MVKTKNIMTIKQLAEKLAWQAFGSSDKNKWLHELQFIMGRNREKSNDTIQEVLEDILKNA